MAGRTILIDGYNLGLEKGTGVATYARNLSYEIGNLGHRVSVVYGNSLGTPRSPLLREIGFFDSGEKERSTSRSGRKSCSASVRGRWDSRRSRFP